MPKPGIQVEWKAHGFVCDMQGHEQVFSSYSIFALDSPGKWLHHTVYLSGEKDEYLFMVDIFILTLHFKHFRLLYLLSDCSLLVSGWASLLSPCPHGVPFL